MVKTKSSYVPLAVSFDEDRKRKSRCIPDQSMSIQEIVRRFVRGIPVDLVQRESVYVNQSAHDLEKLSRMDFAEKAEFARSEAERLKKWRNDLTGAEEAKRSEAVKAKEEKEATEADAKEREEWLKALKKRDA